MSKSRVAEIVESSGNGSAAGSGTSPPKKGEKPDGMIFIPPFNYQTACVRIAGDSPLICNAFPDKLKEQMRGSRQVDSGLQAPKGRGRKVNRPARDFDKEYQDSLYPLQGGGYGFPAMAFKHAIVGACRQIGDLDMTLANRIIFVKATEYSKNAAVIRIDGDPRMREDVVRLRDINKSPDIRYRAEFFPWGADLTIEFNASMLSVAGLLTLINYAGKCEGVGEQRPSSPKRAGDNGQFHVKQGGDS